MKRLRYIKDLEVVEFFCHHQRAFKNVLVVVPDNDESAKQEHGFIERDTERMTKIGGMIVVAWAGELLPVIPGTESTDW